MLDEAILERDKKPEDDSSTFDKEMFQFRVEIQSNEERSMAEERNYGREERNMKNSRVREILEYIEKLLDTTFYGAKISQA